MSADTLTLWTYVHNHILVHINANTKFGILDTQPSLTHTLQKTTYYNTRLTSIHKDVKIDTTSSLNHFY